MLRQRLVILGVASMALFCWTLQATAVIPGSIPLQPSDDADGWYGPDGWSLDDPMDAVAEPLDQELRLKRLSPVGLGGEYDPDDEYRAAMEFDISGVPLGAVVNSATLKLMSGPLNAEIGIYGYAGDGVVAAADLAVESLILRFNHNPGLNEREVTGFVQSLVSSGESYAGFALREETNNHVAMFRSVESDWPPELVIEYVPEPATICLLGLGGLGLLRKRRV